MSRTSQKRLAAIEKARDKGRKDYAEGVPGNLSPYTDTQLSEAWRTGWWSGFKDYPPNRGKTPQDYSAKLFQPSTIRS